MDCVSATHQQTPLWIVPELLAKTRPGNGWQTLLASALLLVVGAMDAVAEEQFLRQRERDRALRQQLDTHPDIRSSAPVKDDSTLPVGETPCFTIRSILLTGDSAEQFQWSLDSVNAGSDPAVGRCLGANGVNLAMRRIQDAIIARGYVTTRVLAAPQDLRAGLLTLTLIPGRIGTIRFAPGTSGRANAWNAAPVSPGQLLNVRDIEQALENFKRVPTAEADIQITPAQTASVTSAHSDVVIAWSQKRPARLSVSVDDSGSKGTGKYQGNLTLSLDDPLSLNDLFYTNLTHDLGGGEPGKRGSRGHTLYYSLPLGYWALSLTNSEYGYHQTVAGANVPYLYRGESRSNELRMTRLLYRDAHRKTSAWSSLWTRSSENFIDDTEIELQRRRMAGWEAGLNHREYLGTSTLELSTGYRRGTGAHHALAAPEEAIGEGTSRSAIITASSQLQIPFALYQQPLTYVAGLRAQWNRTPLVPQDRFSIGSRYTVRGFDGESILSAERGWTLRNEFALNLGASGQQVYAGVDAGRVGGPSSDYLVGKTLVGAVVGLRGGYQWLYYDCSWGTPLKKPDGLQTASLTSAFTVSLSF